MTTFRGADSVTGGSTVASPAEITEAISDVEALYTEFGATYLGSLSSDPVYDNEGAALQDGALYWNTTANNIKVYDLGSTSWLTTSNYNHPNHSGDVTSVRDGATTIVNNAVTLAKMADMATASLLGRSTAGTGDPEVLSAATARTLLNIEDGATADQTKSDIDTLGVDAGTLDGNAASAFATAGHNHTGTYEPADGTILKDADIGGSVQSYDIDIPTSVVSQAEAEAGTATTNRTWTAQRVKQAVESLAPIPTTYGAVGTYAFLRHHTSGKQIYAGSNYAGSYLTPTSISTTNTTINSSGYCIVDGWSGDSFVSGTWRCMGQRNGGTAYAYAGTLFLRIS